MALYVSNVLQNWLGDKEISARLLTSQSKILLFFCILSWFGGCIRNGIHFFQASLVELIDMGDMGFFLV